MLIILYHVITKQQCHLSIVHIFINLCIEIASRTKVVGLNFLTMLNFFLTRGHGLGIMSSSRMG